MSTFLTKDLADTLCTAVAAGFFSINENKTKTKESMKTAFQYQPDEFNEYYAICSRLRNYGIVIPISPAAKQEVMPFIVAKTNRISNMDAAKNNTDEYWNYVRNITANADRQKQPPRGAYIGGMSTISSLFIAGPSKLEQYSPKYREIKDDTVSNSYKEAVKASKTAQDCLDTRPSVNKQKYSITVEPAETSSQPYMKGNLFKSCHGMIRAMTKYQSSIDNNRFYFEIAMGSKTSKVSSCIPCSIFMSACGMPATSTHWGRGDNWNIPEDCSKEYVTLWRNKVKECYNEGISLLKNGSASVKDKITSLLNAFGNTHMDITGHIPDIFLEALTYESSFTDKIKNTLSI